MSSQEELALWRQRFFEAQAGMELYLIRTYGHEEISKWLPVRAELLQGMETKEPRTEDVAYWKDRFFRAQARLEKYVADHHGLKDLDLGTAAIAQIFSYSEPNRGGGARDMAHRIARQAHCYRSDYGIPHASPHYARVELNHCAIWDYREVARCRGVQLTLESPCTFCTKATAANALAKGLLATFTLHSNERGPGCSWEIAPAGPAVE